MRFRVVGAHKVTGKETIFEVDTSSKEAASAWASERGVFVSEVRPMYEYSSHFSPKGGMSNLKMAILIVVVILVGLGFVGVLVFAATKANPDLGISTAQLIAGLLELAAAVLGVMLIVAVFRIARATEATARNTEELLEAMRRRNP
jgi:hypothetical protein